MRKYFLLLAILILLVLTVVFWPQPVDKPAKDGPGPLSVYVSPAYAAPEYHSPLDYWTTHHMDRINRGDLTEQDCLYCHQVERSCNNCHDYVGAAKVNE